MLVLRAVPGGPGASGGPGAEASGSPPGGAGRWAAVWMTPTSAGGIERVDLLPADTAALRGLLRRARVRRLVMVLPPDAVAVRTIDVPAPGAVESPEQVRASMDLIAVSAWGEAIPPHRRGAGVVEVGGQGGVVTVAWAGTGPGAGATGMARAVLDAAGGVDVTFVPEALALAGLVEVTGAAWGETIDAGSGAVSTVALSAAPSGPEAEAGAGAQAGARVLVRTRIEDPAPAGPSLRWGRGPRGGEGVEAAAGVAEATGLEVGGVVRDAAWLERFGLCAGAGAWVARAGEAGGHARRGLLTLAPRAPEPARSLPERVVDGLAPRRRAVAVIAACLALLLLAPLGLAAARHRLLAARAAMDPQTQRLQQAAELQAAFYQALRARRWPMTKLVADLAAAAPEGITVDSLTLEHGKVVRVTGTAQTSAAVGQWRAALAGSGVFDDVRAPQIEASATRSGRFELTARVQNALAAARTTAGGPGASGASGVTGGSGVTGVTGAPAGASPSPAGPGRDVAAGSEGDSTGTPPASGAPASRARGAARDPGDRPVPAATPEIPAPISDEEIAAMDRSTAMKTWAARTAAARRPGVDEATKARLLDEAGKAQARMRAAAAEAGGAGGAGGPAGAEGARP